MYYYYYFIFFYKENMTVLIRYYFDTFSGSNDFWRKQNSMRYLNYIKIKMDFIFIRFLL